MSASGTVPLRFSPTELIGCSSIGCLRACTAFTIALVCASSNITLRPSLFLPFDSFRLHLHHQRWRFKIASCCVLINCCINAWILFGLVHACKRILGHTYANKCVWAYSTWLLVIILRKYFIPCLYLSQYGPRLMVASHPAFESLRPREKNSPLSSFHSVNIMTSDRICHSWDDFQVLDALGTNPHPLLILLWREGILQRRKWNIRTSASS